MTTYFSTFISGLGEFIAEQIKEDLDFVEINLLLDGLVVYKCNSLAEVVKKLRYLNNSFQLLGKPICIDPGVHRGDKEVMNMYVRETIKHDFDLAIGSGNSFRVMFYYANSPVAIDKKSHRKVEERILDAARMTNKKLVIDRTNPDFEYWFLYRQEGYGFFGLRLTKHPDYKDVLAKGQLRPELAAIMVLLSNPQKDEVILDPFAGSGAIPIERAIFPYTKIIAGDINPNLDINWHSGSYTDTSTYRSKYAQTRQDDVQIRIMDALDLGDISNGSIDKIITDPPWGLYSAIGDIGSFYTKMFKEMSRVLKPGGLIVMLVGRNVDMDKILEQCAEKLDLIKSYNILVSGKKAGVFVIRKIV